MTNHQPWLSLVAGFAVLIAVMAPAAVVRVQLPCSYSVQVLPEPAPCMLWRRPFSPSGISPNGRYISGRYIRCTDTYDEACVMDTRTWQLITIPRPAGVYSAWCNDVNDQGVAVGGCWKSGAGRRGWMYTLPNGPWVELPPVIADGLGWSEASAINSRNVICGTRSLGSEIDPQSAFIWRDGVFTDLGVMNGPSSGATDINEHDMVVGWTGNSIFSPNTRAFIYRDGTATVLGPIPGGINSTPGGMNNEESFIVLGRYAPGQPLRSFIWHGDAFEPLHPLPDFDAAGAGSLNDAGAAFGGSYLSETPYIQRACMWYARSPVDITNLLISRTGVHVQDALGISRSGSIIARGSNDDGDELILLLTPHFTSPGDSTCDGVVNEDDLLDVISRWGACGGCRTDFNGDAIVDVADLLTVIQHWSH